MELSDIEKQTKHHKEVQKDLRSQKKTLTDREKDLSNQVIQMTKKLRPVDESIIDINTLEKKKSTFEEEFLLILVWVLQTLPFKITRSK